MVVEIARHWPPARTNSIPAATVEHQSPGEIAEYLEDEDLAEGMRIIGDWPY